MHSTVLTLVLFSAFFAFMCAGFISRSHYVHWKETQMVKAMNSDVTLKSNPTESFARTILTSAELQPLNKWLSKSGDLPEDLLVEALKEDKNALHCETKELELAQTATEGELGTKTNWQHKSASEGGK